MTHDFVIEADGLIKRFGGKPVLNNLTMRLSRGGVHAFIGSNGAGKTTFFRVLLGILEPNRGSSRVLGVDSQHLDPATRGRIGLVNEEHTLPPWMTVGGVTTMHRNLWAAWNHDTFNEVVGHFPIRAAQKISELSRGERAGLNLALALAQCPELLILDEPTLGLDVVAKAAFLESLLFASTTDSTVVYCSHQMEEIERVADNLVILENGLVVNQSTPDLFCARIHCWVTRSIPDSAFDQLPGLLQRRSLEGHQHLFVIDQGDEFAGRLAALGAEDAHQLTVGLDRAVNAYLSRGHASPVGPGT